MGKAFDQILDRVFDKIFGTPYLINRIFSELGVLESDKANKEKGADEDKTKARIIPLTDMIKKEHSAWTCN